MYTPQITIFISYDLWYIGNKRMIFMGFLFELSIIILMLTL